MPNIVFPYSSAPGARPQEAGGRLINAFTDKAPQGAPSDSMIRRSAGLKFTANAPTGFEHTRGLFKYRPDFVYWVLNGQVLAFDDDFAITNTGTLEGTQPVTMARNNAAPTPQTVVVTEVGAFELFQFVGPAPLVLPLANPTSVCDYKGYFIFSYGSGHIYASDLNSTTVSSLSFNIEQGVFLKRVVRYAGRLFAFGDIRSAVYVDAGTTPFPLRFETTIARGILNSHVVAGWEDGWANELIWLGDDFTVYKLQGYTPVPISTPDVSRAVNLAVLAGMRERIEAFVYMYGLNAFWVLHCHNRFTWEFNVTTGQWNERMSHERANWRANRSVYVFDKWLVGSDDDKLWEISDDTYQEGTEPLIWHVESGVLTSFPKRAVIPRAAFHITTGVGTFDTLAAPRVQISWSLDGGHDWSLPVLRPLGGPGQTKSYPSVLRSGISRGQGIRYRLIVSDPVRVTCHGGIVEAQDRGSQP